ncbi:Dom3Z, partial [Caligus rogercresseyi]
MASSSSFGHPAGLRALSWGHDQDNEDPLREPRTLETIYLKAEETEYARRQKFMISPFVEKTMRWGFKFEDYMTAGAESDLDEVLNTFEEFDVMYKSVLGDMSIVYGAEMDAVLEGSRKPFRPEDFVEFKTTKEMQHERQRINFARFKLIKWWCQSFLVGIPSIICGYRDNNGFVGSVKELELKGIPKMTGVDWRPNVCMGFLKNFFYALKQGLIDTPNVVYNVSCEAPGCDIRVIQTDLDMSHVLPT